MTKTVIASALAAALIISAAFLFTDKVLQAQTAESNQEISRKLDEVLRGIADIKTELQVIKIRVTQKS